MSNVLITGGAGYIGSMLSTKLLNLGHKVTVVDLLKYDKGSLNHLYFYKNFKLICDDVRKKSLMKKLVKKHNFILLIIIYLHKKTLLKFVPTKLFYPYSA